MYSLKNEKGGEAMTEAEKNISTVDIAWNCYPAVNGSTAFGKLSKYRDGYAVVHGASYDGKIYLKAKNGTWSATKKAVI